MPKLKELYSYPQLTLNTKALNEFECASHNTYKIQNSNVLVGIEVEAENIINNVVASHYWETKNDGSLRNNGKEFVTHPIKGKSIEHSLVMLKSLIGGFADFSPRTSVHVHMNVRDLTQEELYNLCLLYCLFEKHFFKLANPKREQSLFCVPLYQTALVRTLQKTIEQFESSYWHKYAALNVLPIMENNITGCYGTIEFRHLEGNLDIPRIIQFINSMLCLYDYAKKISHVELLDFIKYANSTSGYVLMYNKIFGDFVTDMSQEDFEVCITATKQNLYYDIASSKYNLRRRASFVKLQNPSY